MREQLITYSLINLAILTELGSGKRVVK